MSAKAAKFIRNQVQTAMLDKALRLIQKDSLPIGTFWITKDTTLHRDVVKRVGFSMYFCYRDGVCFP